MASSTLFVSNFPFVTTEDDLRAAFETHGSVTSVRIIVDRETGRSRGFAFVELSDEAATDEAIEALNNSEFRGRRLIVSHARGRGQGGGGQSDAAPPRAPRSAPSENAAPQAPFRYRIVIEWDDNERGYVASVPTLGVRAHATSIEGAARQARSLGQEKVDLSSGDTPPPDL